MNKQKVTKKSILSSIIAFIMCCTMFIGTTFAWFTDSVQSGKNIIASGNLDIDVKYSKDFQKWNELKDSTNLFSNSQWEPGHTEVVYLRIENVGSLALKYQFSMNLIDETEATNVDGDTFKLSEHLMYGLEEDVTAAYEKRSDGIQAVQSRAAKFDDYSTYGEMAADANAKTVALVVYMPETVGNEANYRGEDAPTIDFGITIAATQLADEADSFGDDYDANAQIGVTNYSELLTALSEGGYVQLAADIAVTGADVAWNYEGSTEKAAHLYVPENVAVTLDLNGHMLANEHVSTTVRYDVIANYGTLTVTDSVGGGELISTNNAENPNTSGGFAVISYGDLTLKNVDIDSNTGSYAVYIEGEGKTMVVEDATVSGRGALAVYNGAHGIVKSGKFYIDVLTTNARDNVLALYNATADVHGGSFDGTLKTLGSNDSFNWKGSSCVMLMGTSAANIYGGTYVAREADLFSHGAGSAIYVYDGYFNTVNALGNSALHEHNSTALVKVLGGTFIYDPTDYLAEGYAVIKEGTVYKVTAK